MHKSTSIQPCISIVIPVYNVQDYLSQCLDSLMEQTFPYFEVICVNDGSTDGTADILEEYTSSDTRIKVYTQENKGAGAARNAVMQHAAGKYMLFLDGDDWFEKNMLEVLYRKAEETQADVVQFRLRQYHMQTKSFSGPYGFDPAPLKNTPVFSWKNAPCSIQRIRNSALGTNLYRTEHIKSQHILFPEIRNTEDTFFIFLAACTAQRIAWVSDPFLNYRYMREGSLENGQSSCPLCPIDSIEMLYDELHERGLWKDYEEIYINVALSHCRYEMQQVQDSSYTEAIMMNRLVSGFFPKTHILDYPESMFRSLDTLCWYRKMYAQILSSMESGERKHTARLSEEEERILTIERILQEDRIKALEAEIDSIQRSRAYQAAEALLYIPKRIKRALRKRNIK